MKFLVAANGADLEEKISRRFGHSNYFLIVDSETFEFDSIEGVGESMPSHGIGRFYEKGIERVIVGNVGPGAFNDLINAGWSVYSCHGLKVREAIEKVKSGQIQKLQAPTMKRSIHEGHHKHS